jgi:hypothetical protein
MGEPPDTWRHKTSGDGRQVRASVGLGGDRRVYEPLSRTASAGKLAASAQTRQTHEPVHRGVHYSCRAGKAIGLRAWWWRSAATAELLLLLGAFGYHQWGDSATRTLKTVQFVVNEDETHVVPLYGEADVRTEQRIQTGELGQNGLIGGQSYPFECWVTGRDGAEWLRYQRFGRMWFAPRAALHPPADIRQPSLPHC